MHSKPSSELRVLVCIHDEENVHTTIKLLQALHPTKRSPKAIYVLHLVKLVGHANPLLIPHKLTRKSSSKATMSQHIVNAFRCYEESNHGAAPLQPFTAISPYESMHDEVCAMVLDRKISLIIVPFNRRQGLELFKKAVRTMNYMILDKAPCSVAILVDLGLLNRSSSRHAIADCALYRVAVLFLGGADDREALAIAARMAEHPKINQTMFQLLKDGKITSEDGRERRLDNEIVTEFRVITAGNHRLMYIEEVVVDGSGTVAVIRLMENNYELLIVGKHHDEQSPLTAGLTEWNEHSNLGIIGKMLASTDFKSNTTILVVQQHADIVNEWEENQTKGFEEQDVIGEEAEYIPIKTKTVW